MTSGKMESPLWKKLQQQQQQQQNQLNNQNVNNFMLNNNLSNDHQQQQQNQAILNQNMTDLNQMFMASNNNINNASAIQNNGGNFYKNGRSNSSSSNNLNNNFTSNVEYGVVERILNSYGFIKALNKEQRLFFPYTYQHQNDLQLKIGDIVEYEETVDQRNGKSLAINIVKQNISNNNNSQSPQPVQLSSQQVNDQQQHQVAAIMNLKELLLKNTNNSINGGGSGSVGISSNVDMNGQYLNQQEQNYQYLMNGLKMLNIQQQQQQQAQMQMNSNSNATNNLNSLLSLFTNNNTTSNTNGNINVMSAPKPNIMTLNEKNDNIISNEYIEGFIVGLPSKRPTLYNGGNPAANMLQSASLDGRIQYQQNGETFYIPFSANDFLYTNQIVNLGDRVRFNVALNNILGAYYACRIEPVNSNSFQQQQQMPKQLYRGIITSLKDTFGKIEREDLLKETFFHFTEYKSGSNANDEHLRIGLNVEFEIQDKYGKEIATNIKSLPEGTVCFDELSQTVYIGRIIQAPIRLNNGSVTLGRLIYDNNQDNLGELTFGENDRALIIASDATANGGQNNKYTLLEGDFVQFRIATDKRRKFATQSNNIQRATQLTLIEEHNLAQNSQNTHENREKGVLIKINNDQIKYGAIKCLEREDLVYFAFNEIINYAKFKTDTSRSFFLNQVKLEVGDSLEFSVMQCQKDQFFKSGLKAIRVRQLAKNSVQFEIISTEVYTGYVDKEAVYTSPQSQGDEINENNCGMIRFDHPQTKQTRKILFSYQNQQQQQQQQEQEQDQQNSGSNKNSKILFYYGDKVQFNIFNCVKTNKQYAVNIKTIEQRKETGFITMLKESYGFIELNCVSNMPPVNCKINSLPKDIFFHFSSLNAQCSANDLEVGDEVEFLINRKTKQKLCADNVTKLPSGTIKPVNNPLPAVLKGKVTQILRSHTNNQDQKEDNYYGKIVVINEAQSNKKESTSNEVYQFGLFSLTDKKVSLQMGDIVSFQLLEIDQQKRAFNIQLIQAANPQPPSDEKKDLLNASSNSSSTSSSSRRDAKRGKVDSIKGHCGYIEYNANTNEIKKVFFHISDLLDFSNNGQAISESTSLSGYLKPGDEVEFILSHNARNGKASALKIKKIGSGSSSASLSSQSGNQNNSTTQQNSSPSIVTPAEPVEKRPEHLVTKLKTANIDEKSGNELILIRQPYNQDLNNKSKSFTRVLPEREPGYIVFLPVGLKANTSNNQLPVNQSSVQEALKSPTPTSTGGSTIFDLLTKQ